MSKNKYIIFEGIDGSGKSTALSLLASKLAKVLAPSELEITKEPSNGTYGTEFRKLIQLSAIEDKEGFDSIYPKDKFEILLNHLLQADRIDHLFGYGNIHNKLLMGKTILQDRSFLSNLAYQEIDISTQKEFILQGKNQFKTVVVYIDTKPEIALERIKSRAANDGTPFDKFEKLDELTRIYKNYNDIFASDYFQDLLKKDWKLIRINGNQTQEEILDELNLRLR